MEKSAHAKCKKTILVHIDPKYLLESDRKKFYMQKKIEKREALMDFVTMVQALKKGKKATRPSWDNGMYVWMGVDYILHTHRHHSRQIRQEQGFPYICEKDDATCNDWIEVNA